MAKQKNTIKMILEYFDCNQSGLAKKMGVSRSAVTQWFQEGIPAERAIQIDRMSRGRLKAKRCQGKTIYDED